MIMRFDVLEYIRFNRYIKFLQENYKSNKIKLTKDILQVYIDEFLLYLENNNIEKSEALQSFLNITLKEEEVKNVKIGDGLRNDKTL